MGGTSSFIEDEKPKSYCTMNFSSSGESSGGPSGGPYRESSGGSYGAPYNESSGESSKSGKMPNKGYNSKGRDVRSHPYPRNGKHYIRQWIVDDSSNKNVNNDVTMSQNNSGSDTEMESGPSNRNMTKKLSKGKGVAQTDNMQVSSLYDKKGKGIAQSGDIQDQPPRVEPGVLL
jgi:hypothetical protein